MNAAVRRQYQASVSVDNLYRLRLSREETQGLQLREIRCPYCGFIIDKVFSDATGHKMITCRKCKAEYPINLGYFRCVRRWKPYEGFQHKWQHMPASLIIK